MLPQADNGYPFRLFTLMEPMPRTARTALSDILRTIEEHQQDIALGEEPANFVVLLETEPEAK